jgi:3-oxoacyl-[acyl-carrier-protein] synthase-1
MASSLGLDIATACAASRAGLTQLRELPFSVVDGESMDLQPAIGHTAASMAEGFEGMGRIMRIMQLGLADLTRRMDVDQLNDPSQAWVLALPRFPDAVADASQTIDTEWPVEQIQAVVAATVHANISLHQISILSEGQASFLLAVEYAVHQLATRNLKRYIVGGADSFVYPSLLQALYEQGRLKTPSNPVGMCPSEASVFTVLESVREAQRREAPILGLVKATGSGYEPDHVLTEKPAWGRGLASVVQESRLLDHVSTAPWLLSDHNGEPHRAADLGHALARLSSQYPFLQDTVLHYPALTFGDTGVASGGVGLCEAIHGFARGHAPSDHALILGASDHGAHGALLVQSFPA